MAASPSSIKTDFVYAKDNNLALRQAAQRGDN